MAATHGVTVKIPKQLTSTVTNALAAAVVAGGASIGGAATNVTPTSSTHSALVAAIAAGSVAVLTGVAHAVDAWVAAHDAKVVATAQPAAPAAAPPAPPVV